MVDSPTSSRLRACSGSGQQVVQISVCKLINTIELCFLMNQKAIKLYGMVPAMLVTLERDRLSFARKAAGEATRQGQS